MYLMEANKQEQGIFTKTLSLNLLLCNLNRLDYPGPASVSCLLGFCSFPASLPALWLCLLLCPGSCISLARQCCVKGARSCRHVSAGASFPVSLDTSLPPQYFS